MRRLPLLPLGLLLISACVRGNAASLLVNAPEYQPKEQSKCAVSKSQGRPLIVEWPSADRMELENKVRRGVAVVRYQGCEMDVLERCSVAAQYTYLGATHSEDRVVMKDADDLYANLPVGAAQLEGRLERAGQLTVAMDLVGRYESDRPTVRVDELQGDCAGATHFVFGLAVGAFEFYSGGQANVGTGVGIAGMGAGAQSEAQRETLTRNGDAAACAKATPDDKAPPAQCGALIRMEVVPLTSTPAPADRPKARCQSIPAGAEGGWQFARFAKQHITGKSASVEITMDDWKCSTAKTDWTGVDTSVPCVDTSGQAHTLLLRSASFNHLCGNTNSCGWMSLADTQALPSFAGSGRGANGYWNAADYDGRVNAFRVGVVDAYHDDAFDGSETGQDLYLSKSFTVCVR